MWPSPSHQWFSPGTSCATSDVIFLVNASCMHLSEWYSEFYLWVLSVSQQRNSVVWHNGFICSIKAMHWKGSFMCKFVLYPCSGIYSSPFLDSLLRQRVQVPLFWREGEVVCGTSIMPPNFIPYWWLVISSSMHVLKDAVKTRIILSYMPYFVILALSIVSSPSSLKSTIVLMYFCRSLHLFHN